MRKLRLLLIPVAVAGLLSLIAEALPSFQQVTTGSVNYNTAATAPCTTGQLCTYVSSADSLLHFFGAGGVDTAVALGAAGTFLPTAGGTMTGPILHSPDNTIDDGAAGATRIRTLFAATSVIVPAIAATTGVQLLTVPNTGATPDTLAAIAASQTLSNKKLDAATSTVDGWNSDGNFSSTFSTPPPGSALAGFTFTLNGGNGAASDGAAASGAGASVSAIAGQGGAGSAAVAGATGGVANIKGGNGGAGGAASAAGNGQSGFFGGGAGGASTGGGAGGNGGLSQLQGGAGGAGSGAFAGGSGSQAFVKGGNGGAGTAGAAAGAGGAITITTGVAGAANGGAGGNGGALAIDTGTGTGSGTAGAITCGTANASSLTIGRATVNTTVNGRLSQPFGAVLAVAANTVAPTTNLHHVGAGLIKTITVPSGFTGTWTAVPDAAYTYDNTGNITVAVGSGLAVVGRPMTFTWDGASWFADY